MRPPIYGFFSALKRAIAEPVGPFGAGVRNREEGTIPVDRREIWVLIDDRAGNTAQSLGVAEALGEPFVEAPVAYTAAARLPNFLRGVGGFGCATASRPQPGEGGWPRLVVAAGRRLAPVARWIKAQAVRAGQPCALCQIMDPGWPGRGDFDLIAVPTHDLSCPRGGNILRVTGSPHRVTAAKLAAARDAWAARLSVLAVPRLAVLVGGATKAMPFSAARAARLGRALAGLSAHLGGSLCVTTSRRTGRAAEAALFAELPREVWAYRWGDAGENPYFGMLAWADIVAVTGDSMSMVSEACGTACPVLIDAPEDETSAKHARLHAELVLRRRVLRLTDDPAEIVRALSGLDKTPLNAAADIAAELRRRGLA
jgi:mitochondrial fission protein ELM1